MELSSVSKQEWVELKSTVHALENRKYICSECLSADSGRTDAVKMREARRNSMACHDIRSEPLHSIGKTIQFNTCIGNFFSPAAVQWVHAHASFEKGVMPFSGSLLDQPAKVVELFRVVRSSLDESAEARDRAAKRKAAGAPQRQRRLGG